jgi:hypothetical protein
MKKRLLGLVAIPLVLMLSSCFSLQGFSVAAASIAPGGLTKANFVMHPFSTTASKRYQFVVVGVDSTDLAIGKATWGVNKTFGGPYPLLGQPDLVAAMNTANTCNAAGLSFTSVFASGTIQRWRAFLSPAPIGDKGAVNKRTVTQVGLKAIPTASPNTSHAIIGVEGVWVDNTSGADPGHVDASDTFYCFGLASSSLYVS